MKKYSELDNKYRFVHIASKRAKLLLKGAKPKVKTKSKNPIRIAQTEVKEGLVDYEVIKPIKPEQPEAEERIFLGGGAAVEDIEETSEETLGHAEEAEEEGEEAAEEFEEEFTEDVGGSDKEE